MYKNVLLRLVFVTWYFVTGVLLVNVLQIWDLRKRILPPIRHNYNKISVFEGT